MPNLRDCQSLHELETLTVSITGQRIVIEPYHRVEMGDLLGAASVIELNLKNLGKIRIRVEDELENWQCDTLDGMLDRINNYD